MALDYKWMSQGGLLLDGTGDIAFTSTGLETIVAMVRTRLKAAVDGWQLYRIGCGLDQFPGDTADTNTEVAIQRQVLNAISNGFLPASMFSVTTIKLGSVIQVYVYLNNQLIANTAVSFSSSSAF